MFCSTRANDIALTCTTTQQKCTGQPIKSAGSKNPLPLGMGSVNWSDDIKAATEWNGKEPIRL